jgi:hypothetical protein
MGARCLRICLRKQKWTGALPVKTAIRGWIWTQLGMNLVLASWEPPVVRLAPRDFTLFPGERLGSLL